jgi:type II secretory pathway pseudopilin PulG
VEVLVSLGLIMTVLVAVLPQLIVGIRGVAIANQVTEAKGVLQGRIERMRSLPFHVAPSAERRIDVLDTYFPGIVAPTAAALVCTSGGGYALPVDGWTGYVPASAGSGKRCSQYEPATGVAFYRKVETFPRAAGGDYTLVTNTFFLASVAAMTVPASAYAPNSIEPATDYDSQTEGQDAPPSTQIGVNVSLFYSDRGTLRRFTTYTQISEVVRSPERILAKANATAIEVASATPDDRSLSMRAGVVNLAGSLSSASKVSANLSAVSARQSSEDAVGVQVGPVSGPPTTSKTQTTNGAASLVPPEGCAFPCWGPTQHGAFTVSADSGKPTALGAGGLPVEARGTNSLLSFGNTSSSLVDPYRARLQLDQSRPLVDLDTSSTVTASTCGSSQGGNFTGRGFVQTTAAQVDSCAEAATASLALFPTSFAPKGVVRVRLTYASARCTVNPTAGTRSARYRYSAEIEYSDPTAPAAADGGIGYTRVDIVGDSSGAGAPTTDALPALLSRSVGGDRVLGDYIASWSSPTAGTVPLPAAVPTSAEVTLPGVLKLVSQPLRKPRASDPIDAEGDPSSVVSLTLGSVGCYAQDTR